MMGVVLYIALCIIVRVAYVEYARHAEQRDFERVFAKFQALNFTVDGRSISGKQLQVVKRITDNATESSVITTIFAYCVLPGDNPAYFLALGQWEQGWLRKGERKWVLRPLTAERMRGALGGDEDALRAAFGDVVGDTLRA